MSGISSKGTSLLAKMGQLRAFEMTDEALEKLVSEEQKRRTFQRAVGRTLRAEKGKAKKPAMTLEALGLAPEMCTLLRAKGLSESALIQQIQKAGLL